VAVGVIDGRPVPDIEARRSSPVTSASRETWGRHALGGERDAGRRVTLTAGRALDAQ